MSQERFDELWHHAVRSLDLHPEDVDAHPVRLHVDNIIDEPADLIDAIDCNQARRQITAEEAERAREIFGVIYKVDNLRFTNAFIAELPYEEGSEGLELVMRLPPSDDSRSED